jgi:hypothetical protein
MSCEATCKIIDLAEDFVLSWEAIARECLTRMSEDEVADMGHELGWLDDDEEEVEEEEEEVEDDDLQRQAHVKLVDGREFAFWVYHEIFDAGDDVENLRTYIADCLLKLQINAKAIDGFEIVNKDSLCEWLGL